LARIRTGSSARDLSSRDKFVGDKAADRLLTCDYRKPYVVPKTV